MSRPFPLRSARATAPRRLRVLLAAVVGAGAALPTASAGDLEFEHLHGGLVHGVHMASDGETGWAVEDGGRIRFTDDGFDTWTFQDTPDTARVQLNGVFFMDDDETGWAVGDKHTILRTTDGGSTWTQVSSSNLPSFPLDPEDKNLWDVHFVEVENASRVTELHGWVAGREGVIWRSTDGGATWESEHEAYDFFGPWHGFTSEDRYGVWFTDDGAGTLHGYICGDWATVLHTSFSQTYDAGDDYWAGNPYWELLTVDGMGHTYTPTGETLPNIELYDVEVDPTGDGFVTGGVGANCGRAYEISSWTTVSWEKLGPNNPAPTPPPSTCPVGQTTAASTLYAMGIIGDGRAIGTGYAANKWRSTTSSNQWEHIYQATPSGDPVNPPLFGGTAVNTTYWAVGNFGTIHRTTNATATTPTWGSIADTETTRIYAVDFISSSVGWMTGQTGRVHKTTDGGATFTETYTPGVAYAYSIDFADADNGVAVGYETSNGVPFVAYTHAGGDATEWTQVTSTSDFPSFTGYSSTLQLNDVVMVDEDVVWAVGNEGMVLLSTDGGETWSDGDPSDDIGTNDLQGSDFVSSSAGVAVGASGGAWITLGSGWIEVPVKVTGGATYTAKLYDVAVRGETIAAVGEQGRVFAYVASAGEFQQVYQQSRQTTLRAVALRAGDVDLFAAGADGAFVWYDGTWKEPNSRTSHEIWDLTLIGDGGAIVTPSYQLHLFDEVP